MNKRKTQSFLNLKMEEFHMNRNFKRVLAGLAALTLCVGVVPHSMPSVVSNMAIVASAADGTPTSEFTFDKS